MKRSKHPGIDFLTYLDSRGIKYTFTDGKGGKQPIKTEKIEPAGLTFFKQTLEAKGITYETEHRFKKPRRFKFDIAVLDIMLAIEYEGIISQKSRHTTITGYTKDTEKYNLAQLEGWTVLRYTASNYGDFENDLNKYLNKHK